MLTLLQVRTSPVISETDPSVSLLSAATRLKRALSRLSFAPPVTHVYNPLSYAWGPYEAYVRTYCAGPKQVVFLGMNPGPFGMAQTGVPFGEIASVRDWLGLEGKVGKPKIEHPKRLVTGFDCPRAEISGQRLWGLFADRFVRAERFFETHCVLNYCPLSFIEATGRNRTPDKLPLPERLALFAACDEHLRACIDALQPQWLIGIGDFAVKRAQALFSNGAPRIGQILHPSPASPAANRNWAEIAARQLEALGVWKKP